MDQRKLHIRTFLASDHQNIPKRCPGIHVDSTSGIFGTLSRSRNVDFSVNKSSIIDAWKSFKYVLQQLLLSFKLKSLFQQLKKMFTSTKKA